MNPVPMSTQLPYTETGWGGLGRLFARGRGPEGSNKVASVACACSQSSATNAFRISCNQEGGMLPDSESLEKRASSKDHDWAEVVLSGA
jgi:hypothetical protein